MKYESEAKKEGGEILGEINITLNLVSNSKTRFYPNPGVKLT